ncbi:MAG: hypothetical protein ACOYI6_10785, partial [Christensenellales bacterium]|jgi:hypothetical protein
MPTYHDKRLKPCKTCSVKPVLEHWSSGGPMYAVRCDNPERPDSCDEAFDYSKNRNPEKAIERWNEYQSVGYLDDVIEMLEKLEVEG